MAVEILNDAMRRIAAADAEIVKLADGFGGPTGPAEGPVWIAEGGYLLFSDIHHSRRVKPTTPTERTDPGPRGRSDGHDLCGREALVSETAEAQGLA